MPRVEWALLCDLAYFDANNNLCVIGAQTQTPVPTLSAGTHRLTIAARPRRPHTPDVAVSIHLPDRSPPDSIPEYVDIESVGNYPLATSAACH